ncbi:MAG: efflux transporter outer membrane subunit [Bacteriovorax sp.]|nr:efflux transporter outer membrane subunit [Rhizobacter sp.]
MSRRSPIALTSLPFALAAAMVTGCAVGPDYQRPVTPAVASFTLAPLPDPTAGGTQATDRAQHFVDAAASPPKWWSLFGSAELDALVDRALRQSPTLAAAQGALRQAQEIALAQRGAALPAVQASYAPTRGRVPGATSSPLSSGASVYTLHTAQVSVSYLLDWFGGNQRRMESLDAQSESQAWQLRAARLTLAANVVNAALQEASLRDQLSATVRLIGIAERQWDMLRSQQRLGAAPGAAVLAQETLLRQAEALAAGLNRQLAQQRDLLAVLVGAFPADLQPPALTLSTLRLPDVPTGMPARLIERRPDVRAAEAQVHSANAELGVALANMLPQLTLTANYGAGAETLGQLFSASGLLWGLGANLAQPLFQGGALLHRNRAAQAQLDQALAQYRGTVLNAFQNVADSLEAVHHDADQHGAAMRQEQLAQRSLGIAQRQLELGDINTLVLLNAEASSLQAAIARVQAHASRLMDVVAVNQALGGSWNEASLDLDDAPVTRDEPL